VAEFIGLVFALVLLIFALLPVLTYLRLGRLSRELETLTTRVDRLERAPRPTADAAPGAPVTARSHPAAAAATAIPSVEAVLAAPAAAVAEVAPASDGSISLPETSPVDLAVPPSIPVTPPVPVTPAESTAATSEDLESRIGGRGLLYTGVLVLLLGVSFFLKYAFDNEWIDETGRVVLGALAGAGLIGAGLRFAAQGLAAFGQALAGTGLAILYLAIYAALNYYQLIEPGTAFGGMGLVTLLAGVLAHRVESQPLAFIAVGGGFLTPFLVGGSDPNQFTLLTYDAVLVVATMLLARHHLWLALNAASYVMTVFTLLAWADTQYTSDLWLRTLLFLTLFVTMFLIILRETVKVSSVVAMAVVLLLATAPLLYHIASVVVAADHPPAIHIYLIAFTAAGLWLTAEPHRPWIRLLVLIGSFAPLFGALTLPAGRSWLLPNIVTIVAVAALHLIAIIDRVARQEEKLTIPDLVALHLSGLGLFALLFEALQPTYPEVRGLLAVLIALGAAGLWRAWRSADQLASLNAAALTFTLIAIGIAVQFDGQVVTIGWAAEGAAIAWVGLRARNGTFQFGGLALLALAVNRLLDGYFVTPAAFSAILNQRAFATLAIVSLIYSLGWLFNRSDEPHAARVRAALHVAGSVITVLWITAEIRSYWQVRADQANAYLYEHMMLSLAWGLYGAMLIAFGMRRAYAPVRYIGMTILAITVLKVFFYDLWELGGIYRVIGFLGFGILLVLVSYLYQRGAFAAQRRPSSAPTEQASTESNSPPVV
jgi:uncharacterized membrane protein